MGDEPDAQGDPGEAEDLAEDGGRPPVDPLARPQGADADERVGDGEDGERGGDELSGAEGVLVEQEAPSTTRMSTVAPISRVGTE